MIIHGRTIEFTNNHSKPVGKAQVKVVGIWRKLSEVITSSSPPNKNLPVFIYSPLYADRTSKTRCIGGNLTREGDDKVLLNPVKEGNDKIRLSNSVDLNLKDLLKIDVGDPYREEVLAVTKIDVGADPNQPAWLTLSWPLMFDHREGKIVQRLKKEKWKASFSRLSEDGHRGHTTLLLNKLQGLTSDAYVRISSTGNVSDEFHRLRIYETKSNDDGFYQIPPLQRVAQVKLQVSRNGKKADVCFQPDYSLYRNQLDLVLK